jgi:hypothetical protein
MHHQGEPYFDFRILPSPQHPEENTENRLNKEWKTSRQREVVVFHTSKTPTPLEVGRPVVSPTRRTKL